MLGTFPQRFAQVVNTSAHQAISAVLGYVRSFTSVDLGPLTAQTAPDLSVNGNDATLTSNVYFSTNGSTGKGIQADCSEEGSGTYRFIGSCRSDSSGTKRVQIEDTGPGEGTVTIAPGEVDDWVDFASSSMIGTPSNVVLGWSWNAVVFSGADWSDIRLQKQVGSEWVTVAHWPGIDSENANLEGYPCLDSNGNGYHGVHSAGVAGGGGETGALQTMGTDFNRRMWFDGVDDYVSLGTGDVLSLDGASKIEWRGYIYYDGSAPSVVYSIINQPIDEGSAGFSVVINDLNSVRVAGRSVSSDSFQTLATAITRGWHFVKAYSDIANSELGISVDDGAYITSQVAFGNSTYTNGAPSEITAFGDIRIVPNTEFLGIIGPSVLLIDNVQTESWPATGNTDADWESTGSANGTVNGSPTQFYPAAQSTTLDALGNPLDFTRPNARVLNGAVDGSYATVADSASRDSTNVFGAWVYHDGSNGVIADYSDGAGTVDIEIVSDAVTTTGLTGVDVFVGNKTTEMANTNTVTEGWNYIFVTFADFNPAAATRYYGRQGHIIEYTETKTLAEAEKNRKATKGQY